MKIAVRGGFTGKERDTESGLDYFGARHLSSAQGRFISPDSTAYSKMGIPQSWNLYAYSFNNPLRYSDLTGNEVQAAACATEQECQKTGKLIADVIVGSAKGLWNVVAGIANPINFVINSAWSGISGYDAVA